MKLSKALLLLSVLTLVACGTHNGSSNSESSKLESTSEISAPTSEESKSVSTSESITSPLSSTSIFSSESITPISSSTSISSSESTTSSEPVVGEKLEINFYNPICGSMSTEKLNEGLKSYINGVAGTEFISEVKNQSSQIANDIPTKGDKILIIGAASKAGSLEFTFKSPLKMITVQAQTYYKPWVDTWSGEEPITHYNVDSNSVLGFEINGQSSAINVDLKPEVEDTPVNKFFSFAVNSNKLALKSLNAEKGRVFIKALTFIY